MISVMKIKEKLIDDIDLLINILEHNFTNIKVYDEEIRMSFEDDSSSNGTVVYLSNLHCRYFSGNVTGDIYTLLEKKRGQSFKEIHRYLNTFFNDEVVEDKKEKKKLFGGFFQQFIGNQNEITDRIYKEEEIKQYSNRPNLRFLEDGININTQFKFGVGYDFESHYITIKWKNTDGDVVGVKGRRNFDEDDKPKYIALKKFKKTNHIYGLYENRSEILKTRTIVLFEAEKSTMQCDTFGFNYCGSIGSHSVSEQQLRLLKYDVDKIVFAYDSDVDEDVLIDECKKVKRILSNVKVGYILDKNKLLPDKTSPSDLGRNVFSKLLKDSLIWYSEDD